MSKFPLDDPEASLESLAGRVVPGFYGEYSEISQEVRLTMLLGGFGVVMPTITLSRRSNHNAVNQWSAFVEEFRCGWFGATPREALNTLYDQWWNKGCRDYAIERVTRMGVMLDRLDVLLSDE
jgi:hypothetical protein